MRDYICQTCGDVVTMSDDTDPWDCIECGDKMVPRDKSDVTPNDELRELAKSWREKYNRQSASSRENSKALAKRECACELLEVLDGE